MPSIRLVLLASLLPSALVAAPASSPEPFGRHAASIGGWEKVLGVESVRAVASIRSPRGELRLELLWGRGGRLVFRQSRGGSAGSMWIHPGLSAGEDGRPLDDGTRAFVQAHDFFGIVLDPRFLFRPAGGKVSPATFLGRATGAVAVRDPAGRPATLHFSVEDGRLAGFEMTDPRRPSIRVAVSFTDYRLAGTVFLPRRVTARDDAGEWVMNFDDVTIDTAPESAFVPPTPTLRSDEESLLSLHRDVLEGHIAGDARWVASEPEDYVIANRGEITTPDLEARRARFSSYLGMTRFTTYRDLVSPVVKVARDGTLGWVICQVEAIGSQKRDGMEEPLSFVSAWIELYEKRDGAWRRVGIVSNFK